MTFGLPQPRMAGSKFFPATSPLAKGVYREPEQATVDAIEEVLLAPEPDDIPPPIKRMTMRAIAIQVAAKHGLTVDEMRSDRRSRAVVVARHEAWWRSREETLNSLPQIGRYFNRDHSTIMHGIAMHAERLAAELSTLSTSSP